MPPKQKPGESLADYTTRCSIAKAKADAKRAAKRDAVDALRRLACYPAASTPDEVRYGAVAALKLLSPGPVPDIDQIDLDEVRAMAGEAV